MDVHDTPTLLRLRKSTWPTKLGALFFAAACFAFAGFLSWRAHETRHIECTHATGCELAEGSKLIAHFDDIVAARMVYGGPGKHRDYYFVELVTKTATYREEDSRSRADAEAFLAPIDAYTRGETESLYLLYPSTWDNSLGLIVPFSVIGLVALLYGILRRGLVELTFDRHEREVLVRTSGLPGLRTSWRFEDVKLETERGAEDRNGQALHTLTLVNIDGRRVAIIHVPGGEAVVAARRVNEILNEPPPEYR